VLKPVLWCAYESSVSEAPRGDAHG
jgi:hypothetical protein